MLPVCSEITFPGDHDDGHARPVEAKEKRAQHPSVGSHVEGRIAAQVDAHVVLFAVAPWIRTQTRMRVQEPPCASFSPKNQASDAATAPTCFRPSLRTRRQLRDLHRMRARQRRRLVCRPYPRDRAPEAYAPPPTKSWRLDDPAHRPHRVEARGLTRRPCSRSSRRCSARTPPASCTPAIPIAKGSCSSTRSSSFSATGAPSIASSFAICVPTRSAGALGALPEPNAKYRPPLHRIRARAPALPTLALRHEEHDAPLHPARPKRRLRRRALRRSQRPDPSSPGLIVARDRAIEEFKPVPYYAVSATMQVATGASFRARWGARGRGRSAPRRGQAPPPVRRPSPRTSERAPRALSGIATACSQDKKAARPRPCPTRSPISRWMRPNAWALSAQAVLDACQSLYETRCLITYPRSALLVFARRPLRPGQRGRRRHPGARAPRSAPLAARRREGAGRGRGGRPDLRTLAAGDTCDPDSGTILAPRGRCRRGPSDDGDPEKTGVTDGFRTRDNWSHNPLTMAFSSRNSRTRQIKRSEKASTGPRFRTGCGNLRPLPPDVQDFVAERLDEAYRLALNGEQSALDALVKAARAVDDGVAIDDSQDGVSDSARPDDTNPRTSPRAGQHHTKQADHSASPASEAGPSSDAVEAALSRALAAKHAPADSISLVSSPASRRLAHARAGQCRAELAPGGEDRRVRTP